MTARFYSEPRRDSMLRARLTHSRNAGNSKAEQLADVLTPEAWITLWPVCEHSTCPCQYYLMVLEMTGPSEEFE